MSAAVPTRPARPVARRRGWRLGWRRCGVLAGVGTLLPLLIAGCAGPVAAPATPPTHAVPTHAVPAHAVPIDAALVTQPGVGPAAPVAPPPGAKQGQGLPPGVPVPP
ncbi:MAG TPA: hypothetical protein VGH72_16230, partial [Pseudonocardia sp.]